MIKTPEWEEMANAIPQLRTMLTEAKALEVLARNDEHFCANKVWYRQFKPRLENLVGWYGHGPKQYRTQAAYDLATEIIYDALPGCQDCNCMW